MSLFLAGDERITSRSLTRAELTDLAIKSARDEALGKRLVAAYSKAYPDASPALLLILIESDRGIILDTVKLAERRAARHTAPVYMYQLAWESPAMGGKLLACHALDVPLVFDNVTQRGLAGGKTGQALAATMSEAWATFARTGSPQTKGLPNWPTYTMPDRSTMIFDEDCRIEKDPGGQARAAWLGSP
jgi:para-nitrobenzyl esterase